MNEKRVRKIIENVLREKASAKQKVSGRAIHITKPLGNYSAAEWDALVKDDLNYPQACDRTCELKIKKASSAALKPLCYSCLEKGNLFMKECEFKEERECGMPERRTRKDRRVFAARTWTNSRPEKCFAVPGPWNGSTAKPCRRKQTRRAGEAFYHAMKTPVDPEIMKYGRKRQPDRRKTSSIYCRVDMKKYVVLSVKKGEEMTIIPERRKQDRRKS